MLGYQIAGVESDASVFSDHFGKASSILLVRPDGYIAFAGNEGTIPQLAKYCDKWLLAQPVPPRQEEQHA